MDDELDYENVYYCGANEINNENGQSSSFSNYLPKYILTPEIVIAYRHCPRECWLKYHDEIGTNTEENSQVPLENAQEEITYEETLELPNKMGIAMFVSAKLTTTPNEILESHPIIYSLPNGTISLLSNNPHLSREENIIYLAINSYILLQNGIHCHQGIIVNKTGIISELVEISRFSINEAIKLINCAYRILQDTCPNAPKIGAACCDDCVYAERCLPDDFAILGEYENLTSQQKRMLFAPKDDKQSLFVTSQEAHIRLTSEQIIVTDKDGNEISKPIGEIKQLVLMGNIQITTPCMTHLMKNGIPIILTSIHGRYNGMISGPITGVKNSKSLQQQVLWARDPYAAASIARQMIKSKISNQRTILRRIMKDDNDNSNHKKLVLNDLLRLSKICLDSNNSAQIMGYEGEAASIYFQEYQNVVNNYPSGLTMWGRNRRPPKDPINVMLSFGYSLLFNDVLSAVLSEGLCQWLGFLHTQRNGKSSLIFDIMEEFRPTIIDSLVLQISSRSILTINDFEYSTNEKNEHACSFTNDGKKKFMILYDRKLNTLITRPKFNYKVSWRKIIGLQVQNLCKVLRGELDKYEGMEIK